MRVICVSPFHHNGRGWPIGEELDVDGEDLQLLLRAGRVAPVDKKGWIRQERPPNVSWARNEAAETARPPLEPRRTW